jgi:hypothetical protein
MPNEIGERAARNNALWCDAVCAMHRGAGEFRDSLWVNRLGVPRRCPDVVTLKGAEGARAQREAIAGLIQTPREEGWAVKDSFHCLDLMSLGFEPLFTPSGSARRRR